MSSTRLIAAICTAQVLAQIGSFSVPALLPTLIAEWSLSNTEAGWVTGIFYAAYTVAVPVLVSLTDRIDPRTVYLVGVSLITAAAGGFALLAEGFWSACLFRALWGVGWAGTYMPGLKALSDLVDSSVQSRAVAGHAASIGISGAASFVVAETVANAFGWRWGIALGACGGALAFTIAAVVLPRRGPPEKAKDGGALLDFRPVLRNRSALAYSLGYMVHTWEMSALRSWVVTFLTFAAARSGGVTGWVSPAVVATSLGLIGAWTSVTGNEVAIRFGRGRFILAVMAGSICIAGVIGFAGGVSYALAVGLSVAYAAFIWADSSSLTAGTVGSADPARRGATMAVHSTLGYFGGFMGPLIFGIVLDLVGGEGAVAWGFAFMHVGLVMLIGVLALLILRPRDLAGDRGAEHAR
jgi:MFS family permease